MPVPRSFWLALFLVSLLSAGVAAADERPNIVIVLVDDMGWSDLGCYGGEVETPQIDALAAGGLRFTQFYNTGRCCPTRASLLTGLYPHQAGLGRMTFDQDLPGYRGELTDNTVTAAEVLRTTGYRTAMVGKWHLSRTEMLPDHMRQLNNQEIRPTFADPASYPVGRGFEEHYGVVWGVVNYFDPFSLVHNTEPIRELRDDYYITDALTERAVAYVEEYSQGDEPFFLYLAYTAPHWPLHARSEDIQKYEDTYTPGWQAIREARYRRQVEMGLVDAETTPLSARHPDEPQWEESPDQEWDAHAMAVHAAMIDRVDQGIGQLVEKLRQLGEYENTLILFLSDNGASPERPGSPGFDRNSETRTGEEVIYFGSDAPKDVLPGPETTYAGIGPHWANVANTPFRYWKATQYEGGIRTPLIVHWPAGLATRPGSLTHEPGHVIDVMATCLEIAGATYPSEYEGRTITPLEGRSLAATFRGEERAGHEALFWEHFGARAVRKGDWKLVARPDGPWELYDLATDQSETSERSAEHPDLVEDLSAEWQAWAERVHVFPQPQPAPRSEQRDAAESERPNIVLILTDDQGWTGSSVPMLDSVPESKSDYYQTPAIERLAAEGMRFSNAYAPHPNCSPTRLSIQLGVTPARLGMTDIIGRRGGPFYVGNRLIPPDQIDDIPAERITVAEWLKAAAPEYATAHFGKWHLGGGGPGNHGYDEHTAATAGRQRRRDRDDDPKQIFSITRDSIDFMRRQVTAGRPFFLQVSHHAVHLPIRALPATVAKYEKLPPGERHKHPGHAAMTEDLDTGIGRVLEAIDELDIADDTWVILTSDNGSYLRAGRVEVTSNQPLAGQKAQVWEGGIRVPMLVRGPDVEPGSVCHVPVIGYDLFPTVRDLVGLDQSLPEQLDGGSLYPLLVSGGTGEVERPREELVWHFPHYQHAKGTTPQSAIRLGDYKLIKFYETNEVRLFNLAEDLGETRDLADRMPDKAAELHGRLEEYLTAIDAPLPQRDGGGR